MATKPKKPAAKSDESEQLTPLDLEDVYSAEPLNAALSGLYAEMGIEGELQSFVTVHKVLPGSGKEARVFKDAPDKYDLDQIAKRFGTGEYVVRVYVQRESGSFVCRGSKVFHMMLDAGEDAALQAIREGRATAVSAPAPQGVGITEILAILERSQSNMLQLLTPILQGAAGSKQNTLQELKGLAETFNMMPGKGGAATDPMQLFGMFQKFMELTNSLKPEKPLSEDEIGPNAIMMKGLEMLLETVKGAKNAQPAALAGMPDASAIAAPAGHSVLPPPVLPAQPLPANEDEEMKLFLKMQLSMMLRAAANDSDVETYAALVFEQAPDDVMEQLQGPDWFAKLVELEPKCAAFQIWFGKLRERVMEMLAEDAQGDGGEGLTGIANGTTVAGSASR